MAILLFLKNVDPANSNRSMAMMFNSFSNFNPDRDSIVLDAITDIIKIYLSTRPDLKAYLDQGSNVISISSWRNYDANSMIQIMRADDINNQRKALAKVKEKLKDGKNVRIIISMYNTLGTGQDLDYAFDKACLKSRISRTLILATVLIYIIRILIVFILRNQRILPCQSSQTK